jgi:predicted nucleic acid-binding protein
MGLSFVLDTNIALYWLKDMLAKPLPNERLFVSVITEIELLSFPFNNETEERGVLDFLEKLEIVSLTDAVKQHAIRLRREYRLKLPDAVIAATALSLSVDLLSNDEKLMHLPGLTCLRCSLKNEA